MKYTKKYFDLWINIVITLIILSNLGFVFFIASINESLENINFIWIFLVLLIESLVISLIITNAYKKPIDELQAQIINFMSGKSKWEKINVNTNYMNPNVSFILKFFDTVLNALKNIKEEFISGKAIKWEVQLATELQEKLLNKKHENIPSLQVIAKSKPAWEIGWDSYDIIAWDDNYYIYVWDATWHGVWAWFVMVMVNALVSWFSKVFRKWNEILANTNEILKPRVKSNILMTMLLLRWNETEKRLFMTWAGHEYLIIYKHSLWKCFKIKSWWLALWMTKNIHKILKEQEIKFEKNDIVVLYTDGITECLNRREKDGNEVMFWEQRLVDAVQNSPTLPWTGIKTARWVFNNITIELSKFLWYKHRQFDDITLVVAHYNGAEAIENDFPEDISKDFITEWDWE